MAELCPGAWLLNYTNPMAMLLLGDLRGHAAAARRRALPLGAGHDATSWPSSSACPFEEVDVPRRGGQPPGVHPPLRARRRGPLPAARRARSSATPSCSGACASRCTAGSATSPPSRASTRPSTCRGSCAATRRSSASGSRSATTSRRSEENLERVRAREARSSPRASAIEIERSQEYASLIIHSIETGEPRVIYGNVRNDGLIANLPARRLRRGAVPGRRKRRPADRRRARCRRSSPRSTARS